MSSAQMSNEHATQMVDLKLEVVVIPVSDVDRAKRFYGSLRPPQPRLLRSLNDDTDTSPPLRR